LTINEDATGKRFSLVYLTGGEALPDSPRARVRIATLLDTLGMGTTGSHNPRLAKAIEHELGVRPQYAGDSCYYIDLFIERCELRDFLDLVTLVHSLFGNENYPSIYRRWLPECRRIFSEERLRYVINDAGGVRFSVDAEFERSLPAVVQGLGHPALRGALHSFDEALAALSETPPDGKAAIRNVFEAVEITFKTLCPGPPRIGNSEISGHLAPKLEAIYAGDATAKRAAQKLARSLAEWVEGAHFYRHGQTGEDPVQPPLDLAVVIVSEGASLLRWLAGLHGRSAT
jgi:hypothetical protein